MLKSFLSLILIFLLVISSLSLTIYQVLRSDFLTDQARQVNLYGRLAGRLEESLKAGTAKQALPLNPADLAEITTAAITADRLYDFSDRYIAAWLDWLTGRSEKLSFQFNLEPVKQDLKDKALERQLANYDSLPECRTAEELKVWQLKDQLPSCKLPVSNTQQTDIKRLVEAQLDQALTTLPDQFTAPKPNQQLEAVRSRVILSLQVMRAIWLATGAILLLFIVWLRRRVFLPLATVFLFVGLIQIGFNLIVWDWAGRSLIDRLTGTAGNNLAPFFTDLITAIVEVMKTIIGNLSIGLLATGLLMLIFGLISQPKKS